MTALIPLLLALALQDAAEPLDTSAPPVEPEPAEAAEAAPPADPEEPPVVSIRTERNGDRVEEYRQNGRLYMVKVTPERGAAYYLMDTDGNGRFNREDVAEHVAPVYWTLYEWD